MQEHVAQIAHITTLSPAVKCFRLLPLDTPLDHRAGQHVGVVTGTNDDGTDIVRYYSVASAPRPDGSFDLCIADAGGGSASLHACCVGDELLVRGPSGKFTFATPADRDILLVGTGTGVAPLRAFVQELVPLAPGRRATLLLGARTRADILYGDEFRDLEARERGFRFLPTLSRPDASWTGLAGRVQDHVESHVDPAQDVYVCGHAEMVADVRRHLAERHVPESHVHFERY